jgi:fatty-acyl-CoA synthase
MTETSPVCTTGVLRSDQHDRSEEEQAEARTSVGSVVPGVELRITEPDTGAELPWDGETTGELQVRGPWVARTYYADPRAGESFTADGWLRTGDVARVTGDGRIWLVDRTKDLIKSGGEWISSAELENEIMAHPAVAEAAVIGVTSQKWSERPLACIVPRPGSTVTAEELRAFLEPRVAKWWLPDAVEIVPEIPKTSVGKFAKRVLREQFAEYHVP